MSIQQARQEVQERIRDALVIVEQSQHGSAARVERQLWTAMLALGRALMGVFFAHRAAAWLGKRRRYLHDGKQYEVVRAVTVAVGTQFGKLNAVMPVGCVVGGSRGARDLPLARELELPGGFTLLVVTTVARLCAQMAFASTRGLLKSLLGWAPSQRSVLRMVDAVGEQAEAFSEQAEVPEDDGEVLVIVADSKGAPSLSSREQARRRRPRDKVRKSRRQRRRHRNEFPRIRRGPGKKSKNAKMATVGVLYTLRRLEDRTLDGPCNKHVIATFDGDRALFERLQTEAKRRGYGTGKFTAIQFISDGARPLRALQKEFFPDAERCLDWVHAVEYLWNVGKAVCRNTRTKRTELEAWVRRRRALLRQGKVVQVIQDLEHALEETPLTGPGNKYRRKVLADTIRYFGANQQAMNYRNLRRRDLEISSGVAEGAVRHVVGLRLDGPGMRWGRDRAEAVLQLRCILVNGQWPAFERYLADLPTFHLAAQPVPARPHDAETQDAA